MAIADTITSMYENVGEVYDTITNVEMPTNKNIENIPSTIRKSYLNIMNNGYQDIWDSWDKVNGSGTSLTLDNTEEAPMSLVYKGNTSQEGTPNPDYPQDVHVVSGDNSIEVVGKNLYDLNTTTNIGISSFNNGIATTISLGNYGAIGLYSNATLNIEENIDYYISADIRLVSGTASSLNYIQLFTESGTSPTRTRIDNPTLSSSFQKYCWKNTFTNKETFNRLIIQITTGTNAVLEIKNIMISKSNDTTYEPYQGASYPISLGVDNLIPTSLEIMRTLNTSGTWGGYTFSKNETTVKVNEDNTLLLNGTATSGYAFLLASNVTLKAGTYILNGINSPNNEALLYIWDSSWSNVASTNNSTQFTLSEDKVVRIGVNISNGKALNNLIVKPMISKNGGTYTPYGTTPIELCKIGNYQDKFIKTSGKNLFDEDSPNILDNSVIGSDGSISTSSNYIVSDYIPVQPNTQYTISYYRISGTDGMRVAQYQNDKTFISRPSSTNNPYLLTTPNNCYYIRISYLTTQLINVQVEKGNIETPVYEPYGTDWYLKKEIGKYTITGQESDSQYYWSSEINGIKFVLDDAIKTVANAPTYCNRFNQWYSGTTANNYVRLNRTTDSAYTGFWFGNITIEGVNSITTFKSYATNNQILLYYPLATPTYTKITDETLLNQLEAIRSETGQTNISQENNDLPFVLDVVALKEMN